MHIQRDWKIEFKEEDFIAFSGGSMKKMLSRASVREDWEAALAEVGTYIHPAAIWDAFPIREFKHERVILANGAKIGGGPVAAVVAGAAELLIGVCTVGSEVSQRVSQLQQDGSRMRAMFLDTLGTWSVGQVREQFFRQLEIQAINQGLHASTTLAPGESTWPVSEQAVLFSALDASQIGVTLTPSMMMNPVKSVSFIMGVGPNPLGSEGGANCDYCTIRDTCAYSRKSQTLPAAA
ncbi:MAG TPA: vitamin B12 dependent-methionine synthase activation domain-containing protein [Anaerolineaceae bacterium]|jgi:hypothetical protein